MEYTSTAEQELKSAEETARAGNSIRALIGALRGRAEFYRGLSEMEKALPLAREAVDLARRSGDSGLRELLRDLATIESRSGRTAEADRNARELIRLGPGRSVEDHIPYVEGLIVRATAAYREGAFDESDRRFREAVELSGKLLGEKHDLTIHTRDHLSAFLLTAERYQDALEEQRRLCDLEREAYGQQDPRFVDSLSRLAQIHDQLGSLEDARGLYQYVLEYRRAAFGPDDPKLAEAVYNLAELARISQNHDAARRGFTEVMEAEEQLRGRKTLLFVFTMKNFGLLEMAEGHHAAAERLLSEAVETAVRPEFRGVDAFAGAALAFGELHALQSRPAIAVGWFKQSLAEYERLTGADSPSCARVLLAMARCEARRGAAEEALAMAEKSVQILENRLGSEHWESSAARHQLGIHLAARGRWDEALESFARSAAADDRTIAGIIGVRSRHQTGNVLQAIRARLGAFLGILCAFEGRTPEHVRRAFDYVIRRKGLETAAARLQRDSGLPWITGVESELRRLRRRILRLKLRSAAARSEDLLEVERLRAEMERRESQLAASVPEERIWFHLFESDTASVARGLPRGACLVEMVDDIPMVDLSRAFEHVAERRLLAFVLTGPPPGELVMKVLGPTSDITRAVEEFRTAIEEQAGGGDGDDQRWFLAGERVRTLMFDPLVEAIGEAKQLLIAPDGALDLLAFEALPLRPQRFLLDDYCISYLRCGRELSWKARVATVNRDTASGGESGGLHIPMVFAQGEQGEAPEDLPQLEVGSHASHAVVVADPDFDAPAGPGGVVPGVAEASPPSARPEWRWTRLPASAAEGAAVARRLDVEPCTRSRANKTLFANLRSPEILHVSTHGFLAPRVQDDRLLAHAQGTLFVRLLSSFDDPLLRCGLALASANASVGGSAAERAAGEGLLWATEALELDLRTTDLVVLSACHTGLGELRLGDGAAGLRRAFRLAGARSVISSMWAVADDAAQELMGHLYDRLLAGEPRAFALWNAKIALRNRYPRDPSRWGAFVLEGATGELWRFQEIKIGIARFPKVFNEMIRQQKKDSSAAAEILESARDAENRDQFDKALLLLRRVPRAKGATPLLTAKAEYVTAGIYRRTGRYDKALAAYDKLLARTSLDTQVSLNAHFDRGTTHVLRGDYASAVRDYTDVLLSSDTSPTEIALALVNRGGAFQSLENRDAALEDFSSVIAMNDAPAGQHARARNSRGNIFVSCGDYEHAVADYTAALETDDVEDEVRFRTLLYRARAFSSLGRMEEACDDLEAATECESASTEFIESVENMLYPEEAK